MESTIGTTTTAAKFCLGQRSQMPGLETQVYPNGNLLGNTPEGSTVAALAYALLHY